MHSFRTLFILVPCVFGGTFLSGCSSSSEAAEAAASDGTESLAYAVQSESGASPRRSISVASISASGVNIYVSPTGRDDATGSSALADATGRNGPLATLAAAQAAVRIKLRAMTAGAEPRKPINVLIAPGEYVLTRTLRFTSDDSGVSGAPVTYAASQPGTVFISGGEKLRAKPSSGAYDEFFAPTIHDAALWRGAPQLFVNGERATLARQPNAGNFWFVLADVPPPSGAVVAAKNATFKTTDNAAQWLAGLTSEDRDRAVVNLYQSWTTGKHRLAAVGDGATVSVLPGAKWPNLSVGSSQRYFIENVAAALDAPGEWIGSSSGVKYLAASATEPGKARVAVMPTLETLVAIEGGFPRSTWVHDLQFAGLTFQHARSLVPADGWLDMQAAENTPAAVQVDAAYGIVIADCKIEHTGGYGIWFRRSVQQSEISGTVLSDLGAGGIRLGLRAQSPTDALGTGSNRVVGNAITDTGKIYPGAVGIWVGQTSGNVVAKNLVARTTYSGISVGWQWGYGTTTASNNIVESNLLYNIGQAELSDLAGIYTLGVSPGTRITKNLIREVRGYPGYGPGDHGGAWGIYNDEGSSQTLAEGNIVLGTDAGGYHLHYGKQNTVRNNVFASGRAGEARVTRVDAGETNLSFLNNTLMPEGAPPFDATSTGSAQVVVRSNTVASNSGASVASVRCGTDCRAATLAIDAKALPGSVAFSGIDDAALRTVVADAGPAASLLEKAGPVLMERPVPKLVPPAPFVLDIVGTTPGTQPKGMKYLPANDLQSIRVSDSEDVSGRRCLKLTDSPNMRWSYEPYTFALLNYERGGVVMEADLRIDDRTELLLEWRDAAGAGYKTGPALSISARGIYSQQRYLSAAPLGSWFTVRVSAKLGDQAGNWTLEVLDSRKQVVSRHDGLALKDSNWQVLKWLGIISNAKVDSSMCVGALSVTPQ